jgi:hypothetical protein
MSLAQTVTGATLALALAAGVSSAQPSPAPAPPTPRPMAAPAPEAPPHTAAAPTPMPPPALAMPRPHGEAGKSMMFQIALVQADNLSGSSPQQALPKGVQKALTDIQDFLPFKSYRLLDSALVRGSGEAHARLTGPQDAQYEAAFMFNEAGDGILIDPFNLIKMPEAPAAQPMAHAATPRAPEPAQTSSFRIRRGETVVVGSSRINDSSALIVVLTALP